MATELSESALDAARLPETGFVRLPQILRVLPIGKSTWWAGVRTGRYPPPVRMGPGMSMWRVSEIRELLSELAESPQSRRDRPGVAGFEPRLRFWLLRR